VPFRPRVGRLRASALLAPATFALRRARARRVDAALTALVFAAACGIVGSLSLIGAIARREATADLFRRIPPAERSVVSRVGADPAIRGSERNETAASRVMLGLRDIAGAPALVRVWGPVAPADERGTRVVRTLGVHPRLVAGRRPRECRASRCEGVALGREPRLGAVVRWSGVSVRVVGRATLPAAAVEGGIEPIPGFRRIDPTAGDDAQHVEIAASPGQGANDRATEGCRDLLDRGPGRERAHLRLLGVEVTLQRVLDRRIAERLQRPEVVADRRDIGPGGLRELAQHHAALPALGEQVQRGIQKPRTGPHAGLATLIGSRRFHRQLFNQALYQ
jgi:hypothetical protein